MSLRSAKSTLVHYFELSSRGEWRWDSDNRSEIEGVVDDIVETAVSQARAYTDKALKDASKGLEDAAQLIAWQKKRIETLENMIKETLTPPSPDWSGD